MEGGAGKAVGKVAGKAAKSKHLYTRGYSPELC